MLELRAVFDEGAAQSLREQLLGMPEVPSLVLSAEAVARVHTLGVQMLVAAHRTWREKGSRVQLQQPSQPLAEAFATLGLQQCWEEMTHG
jgi:anti-anti-sigma regulatory factor